MLLYLIQAIFSFFFILFVGRIFLSFLKLERESIFLNLFLELFAGFYGLISLFSIIKTGGISIATAFIFWIFIWLVSTGKIKKPTLVNLFKFDKWFLIEILSILIFMVVVNYLKFFSLSDTTPVVISWDALSDVTRSIYMNYTGIENTNTNFIQHPTGTLPYHYFEAWSVAFLSTIFGGNYWLTQGILFQPIILVIIYSGFRTLTTTKISRKASILLGFLLFFSSGIVTDCIRSFSFFEWVIPLRNNVIDEPWWTRLSVLFPPILLSLYCLTKKKWTHTIFTILLIPFLSVTPAIPIICSVFGVVFLCLLFSKHDKKKIFILLLIPIITAAIYQGFYLLFKDTSEFISLPTISDILIEIGNIKVIKSKVIMIIEKVIQTILLYSPFLLIIILGFIKCRFKINPKNWAVEHKIIGLFILILTISSLMMWQVLYFLFGASFFYYYTMIPFFNIICIYLIYKLISSVNFNYKPITIVFVLILTTFYISRSIDIHISTTNDFFIKKYSSQYLSQIQKIWSKKIDEKGLSLGIKIEDPSEIIHPFFNDGIPLCGSYLYGIVNAPGLISLSRADLPESKLNETNNAKSFTINSSFYLYVHNRKINNITNINLLKKKFIKEYSIRYGIVSPKGKIPEELKDIIDIIISDKQSKERFIVFKK